MFPFIGHKSSKSLKQKNPTRTCTKAQLVRLKWMEKHCNNTCRKQSLVKLSKTGCVTAVGIHLIKVVHNYIPYIQEIFEMISQNKQLPWTKSLPPQLGMYRSRWFGRTFWRMSWIFLKQETTSRCRNPDQQSAISPACLLVAGTASSLHTVRWQNNYRKILFA